MPPLVVPALTAMNMGAATAGTVGTVLSVASTGMSLMGGLRQASAAKSEAKYNAALQRQEGKTAFAAGTARAQEEMRKGELAKSAALAASAKGGGAGDVGVQNIIGDLAGQSEYNTLMAAYEGKQRMQDLNANAALTMAQGKAKSSALRTEAITDFAGSSLWDKYAPKSGGSFTAGDAFAKVGKSVYGPTQPIKWS